MDIGSSVNWFSVKTVFSSVSTVVSASQKKLSSLFLLLNCVFKMLSARYSSLVRSDSSELTKIKPVSIFGVEVEVDESYTMV